MAASSDAAVLRRALPAVTAANPALLASGTFHVVAAGDRLVGCGAIDAGVAHLRHFATDPDAARQGIGRSIVRRCAAEARSRGLDRFPALAGLNAEPFYARLGLRRLRVVDLPMGPSVTLPVVLMEGPIEPA